MDWKLFASTFTLIFISELPDKTAFATFLMATRNRPFPVFVGAAGAFIVQSFVAVAFGSLLTLLPHKPIQIGAGILFLLLAFFMWRREAEAEEVQTDGSGQTRFMKTMMSAFAVIFVAEWGDLTQLATAAMAARYAAPVTIFMSATLALWAVTGIGAYVGHSVRHRIEPRLLQRIAAAAFVGVGVWLLLSST
jgi:Ca2+/H+ antiporter, TMEM165/GDT1 family